MDLVLEKSPLFYERYREEYQNWKIENPKFEGFVRVEEKEELTDAITQGLLYSIYDQGKWAGLVAGREKLFYGTKAIYIFELFLTKQLRGKKIARILQGLFLENIRANYEWVWGEIHGDNLPSLKTAQSLGRKKIMTQYFIPFDVPTLL